MEGRHLDIWKLPAGSLFITWAGRISLSRDRIGNGKNLMTQREVNDIRKEKGRKRFREAKK
jgi:hypothetical protein